jgi:excisionase family DNA binding protein
MPEKATTTSADAPAYLPLAAAAEGLHLHPITLRRAISAGELAGFKFGSAVRVRVTDLERWAASKAIPNARSNRGRVVA